MTTILAACSNEGNVDRNSRMSTITCGGVVEIWADPPAMRVEIVLMMLEVEDGADRGSSRVRSIV